MSERASLTSVVAVIAIAALLSGCRSTTEPDDPIEPDGPILAGGSGDQRATDVATDGSAIYVSGPGIISRFDPATGSVTWSVSEPGVFPEGIATAGGGSSRLA